MDRRIYVNFSKSIQSVAGLKALKSAANGRYVLNVRLLPAIFVRMSVGITVVYCYPYV